MNCVMCGAGGDDVNNYTCDACKEKMKTLSFRPEPLSPEHARQVERFTGKKIDPEGYARWLGWIMFCRWHHGLKQAAAAQRRQKKPGRGKR